MAKVRPAGRDQKGRFKAGNKIAAYTHQQMTHHIENYCNHIANGKPKESYRAWDYRTIDRYLAHDPSDKQPMLQDAIITLREQVRIAFATCLDQIDAMIMARAAVLTSNWGSIVNRLKCL